MRTLIIITFISSILFNFKTNSYSETIVDTVLASINGDPITLVDLKIYMSTIIEKKNWDKISRDEKQNALTELLNRKVLFMEAEKMGISADEDEIESSIEDVIKKKGITRKELEIEISGRGIPWGKYIDEIKYQIIKEKIFQRVILTKIEEDNGKLQAYYNQNKDKFKRKESAHLYHIMFPFNENDPESAHKKAMLFSKELNSARNFIYLAEKYTGAKPSDVDIGIVRKGDLLPDFDKVIFLTPEGKATPPIRSNQGYHIFFVVKKTGEVPKPFEEALPEVKELYYRENSEKLYIEWLNKVKNKYVLKFVDIDAL